LPWRPPARRRRRHAGGADTFGSDALGAAEAHCSEARLACAQHGQAAACHHRPQGGRAGRTDVYNLQGEKLGTVDDLMIDKVSGKAVYAIMSFGGFLGIGEKYHPLPWSTLKYDESKGGYLVNLDKKMLENAPSYGMDEDFLWTPDYGRRVDKYYNAPSYW
jgi:hypothetical protein